MTSIAATLQANGSFVIVDEKSGALRESPNYLGQWIEVDAAGQRLVAAGMFSRVVGQDLVPLPRSGPGGAGAETRRGHVAEGRPLRRHAPS